MRFVFDTITRAFNGFLLTGHLFCRDVINILNNSTIRQPGLYFTRAGLMGVSRLSIGKYNADRIF